MNDKQRLAKLQRLESLLKRTKQGYHADGTYWRPAMRILDELQADAKTPAVIVPKIVFPIGSRTTSVFVGGLHPTAGLAHNWALDFICHAGLPIVAPEAATVTRFSGHDPSDDQADRNGVYGWTTYLETPAGYEYFITHQGGRYPTLRVGQRVTPGQPIGFVGDQRFRPDHAHVGVTSPKGEADAKARILKVSKAPRVSGGDV